MIRTAVATITPRADMCFALASYLTRERGKRIPRRVIETLFWPTMHAGDASHSLSELIHKLRGRGVLIERDEASCIWLPREHVSIDVELFSREPLARMADRDLSILPGYTPRASPAFNDWVDEWRDDMRNRVLDNLVAAIPRATAARDWSLSLALARQALRLDPANEPALIARARAAAHLAREDISSASLAKHDRTGQLPSARLAEPAAPSAWQLRSSMTTAARDTALVGRELPMARLRNKATKALDGKVCSAYVSGPAGIGKSRIVREISGWMAKNGAAVCAVACERPDGHRPLSAFIQAVPRLQTLPGAAGCDPSTIACLARITQLSPDEPDMNVRDDSLHLSAAIRTSVIDLIGAVTDEQPLLFVVEDVHWIDPASWALLRTIVSKAQHSIFVLCTSRVAWQHVAWGVAEYFRLEELPALDPQTARAHMQNYLTKLERTADEQYIAWCVETSNGNPYFIEELVNFWVSTGEQYTAPPSLVALVEARLARLKPDALRVIQAAAVLGKNSTIDLLHRVLEFPTHALFSSIEELSDAGLLTISSAATNVGTEPVLCRHDLVIGAATRGLSTQGRALLHHAAARAMEATAAGNRPAELLWDCADHWHAAGQVERSIGAAVSCARHLHDMGLVHDAVKRCESALAMCRTDATRIAVLRTMAQSQYAARDWRAFCKTVAEVRGLENTTTTAAPIHDDLELCELSAQRNLHRNWTKSLDMALCCVKSVGADASHRVQAAINVLTLATNVVDLQIMDMVYHLVAPLLNDANVRIQDRLTIVMIYHTIRGDSETSALSARELLLVAERTLPLRYRLGVMLNCASALRRSGMPGEGEAVCERLFHTAVPLRCFDFAAEACNRLIEMHLDAGRSQEARDWVVCYRELRRPNAELRAQRTLRIAMARVDVSYGEWEAADRLLAPNAANRLWEDAVTMLRSAALATKIRIEIGRGSPSSDVTNWVTKLAPLSAGLRTVGAQDYECFSLYLGYRHINEIAIAEQFLQTYARGERRDTMQCSPEIADELSRLRL